jgi:trimethylamine-N-oxide reductase (cytochrome c)
MVVSAFLVEVAKVNIEDLKRKYPDAFKRKLDPRIGPCYESWVVG